MKNPVLRILLCLTAAAGAILVIAGCRSRSGKTAAEETAAAEEAPAANAAVAEAAKEKEEGMIRFEELPEEPVFDIVTSLGTIKVKLYSKTPKHRENFAKLALSGYYDSLLFHRVIKDFMIQAGDPYTRDASLADRYGQGGPNYTIPAEFVPEYRHKKGALAAARRGDAANPMKESSGSQFYIVQNPESCSHLDGDYTVFGETVSGLSVVDKIAAVKTDRRGLPVEEVRILTVKLDDESKPAPKNSQNE